jgi:purine-binding chemotaxis protein CheW
LSGCVEIYKKVTVGKKGGKTMAEVYNSSVGAHEDAQKGMYLTFFIGNEVFGIEIRHVMEIVGIQARTALPEMPEYIKGLINLRGNIIPLLDVRLRFGKEPREYDDRTCVIVIDISGTRIGLIVDSVSEVITIPDEDITELPKMGLGSGNRYLKKVGKVGDEVKLLIDCEKFLTEDELVDLNNAL